MDRVDLPGTSPGEGVAAGALAPRAPASAPELPTQAAGGWRDQISVEVKRLAEVALAQALEAVVAGRGPRAGRRRRRAPLPRDGRGRRRGGTARAGRPGRAGAVRRARRRPRSESHG